MRALPRPARVFATIVLLSFSATACFQMDYVVQLEEDLSGEAEFDITVDLDRMAYAIAAAEKAFMGDGGQPTDEEVQIARDELLAQLDSGVLEEDHLREQIDPDLPPGVTLLSADQRRDGLRTEVSIRLAFDHLNSLGAVDVGPDGTAGANTAPFGGIEIVDEGDTFVLRNEPMNPMEEVVDSGMPDGMGGLLETMFQDMSIAFTIVAPFDVVEHNASDRDGNRLRWVYDYDAMVSGQEQQIFVRYRKP